MHIQIVTFALNGVSEEQYLESCRADTDTFAALPGLISKIWLRDAETNTYGGLYLWRDREAFEAYVGGDIFAAIENDDSFDGVESRDLGVIDDLTKATQPGLTVL